MHKQIVGITTTGKTRLAKLIAQEAANRGRSVLVLDPNAGEWGKSRVYTDTDVFMHDCQTEESCLIFIDEAGEALDKYDSAHNWLATRSRHWGHQVYFISQDALQVARLIRDQCIEVMAFAQSRKAAETLAYDYNNDILLQTCNLKRGEFIHVRKLGDANFYRLDVKDGTIQELKIPVDTEKR